MKKNSIFFWFMVITLGSLYTTYAMDDPRDDLSAYANHTIDDLSAQLIQAVRNCDDRERVRELLDRGATVNATSPFAYTPLHIAAENGSKEIAQLLIDRGANIHALTRLARYTPLHWAARNGHVQVAQLLLAYGANIHALSSWGETPLQDSVKAGHEEVVQLFIQHDTQIDKERNLLLAAYENQIGVARLLLDHGARVNAQDLCRGNTPLHCAAYYGYVDMARLLIEHGANIHAQDKQGRTPLYHAVSQNHVEVTQFLRERSGEETSHCSDAA